MSEIAIPNEPQIEMPKRGLKFLKAWAIAQKAMGSAKKDKTNPHFNSSYATMESVVEAISGPFEQAGLVWIQEPFANPKSVGVTTYVLHAESGEGTCSRLEYPAPSNGNPQVYGSLQSYIKRYGLQTAAGLPTSAKEDDDGNAASHRSTPPLKPPPSPKAPASAPPKPGEHRTGVTVPPKWKNAGKDLAELTPSELNGMADFLTQAIADPAKSKWQAMNQKLLDAVSAEGMRREQK